jgi:hypothetical protein
MSSITWRRGGAAASGPVVPSSAGPAVAPAAAGAPETTPAQDPQRDKAGALLAELYEYLKANARQHPALAPAIPALSSAVALHRAGQNADPFAGVRTVYNAIQAARRIDPSTPEA